MKKGKAQGPNDIPVEAWIALRNKNVEFLVNFFSRLLRGENMPEEWRRSMLLPLYKVKKTSKNVQITGESTEVKKGRPSRIQSEYEKKIKRGPIMPIPDVDIRRDQIRYMSIVMGTRQRCKQPLRKGQTVFKCIKCEVYLRLHKNSNCFSQFHE